MCQAVMMSAARAARMSNRIERLLGDGASYTKAAGQKSSVQPMGAMRNVGRPVTRATLSEEVWNIPHDPSTNIVDVYMKYVRDKVDIKLSGETAAQLRDVVVRITGINLPAWTGEGWFFNPLAWQILFMIGAIMSYAPPSMPRLRERWPVRHALDPD